VIDCVELCDGRLLFLGFHEGLTTLGDKQQTLLEQVHCRGDGVGGIDHRTHDLELNRDLAVKQVFERVLEVLDDLGVTGDPLDLNE